MGKELNFDIQSYKKNKDLNFSGFTQQMVLEMCILSGCDYLASLPGLGLKKAHALVKKFRSYDKVIKHLRYSTVAVSPGYEEAFEKAILTFRHQRVYDPVIEDIVHLSAPSENICINLDFLGPYIPQHMAKGIAVGDIDPLTMLPFQGLEKSADLGVGCSRSYEQKHFKTEAKKLELPAQKNLLTNYFCFASFEAKRKYQAPRIAKEDTLCCENSPQPQSENLNVLSPNNSVEKGSADRASNSLEPQNLGLHGEDDSGDKISVQYPRLQKAQPIYKPCATLYKQRMHKPASYVDECRMRKEHTDVVIRSRYFQHKPACTSDVDMENDKDDVNMGECENVVISWEDKVVPVKENARLKKRKTTVQSSYFQEKSIMNEHNQDIGSEENQSENDFRVPNNPICDNVPLHIMDQYNMGTNASNPLNKKKDDTEVEKFGSNISHLETYSDIAEKSMERFVSVISSFKCSPGSGSRASGLRAPLKDVRNTCSRRSTTDVDFSKYAYLPTRGKALPSYRSRKH